MIEPSYYSVGRREQGHEFVVLNLPRTILVNVLNKFLYIDCHLKLMLNDFDEIISIDTAFLVGQTAQSHECVECILLIAGPLELLLLSDHLLELVLANLASVVRACLRYHPVDLLIRSLLSHHFEDNTQFLRINKTTVVFIES